MTHTPQTPEARPATAEAEASGFTNPLLIELDSTLVNLGEKVLRTLLYLVLGGLLLLFLWVILMAVIG